MLWLNFLFYAENPCLFCSAQTRLVFQQAEGSFRSQCQTQIHPPLKQSPSEKTIFQHLDAPLLVADDELTVVFCNEAASQFWERDKKKIIGNPLATLLSSESPILPRLEKVLQEGKELTLNSLPLWISPLSQKIVHVSMRPIFQKPHPLKHALLLFHDVTYPAQIKEKEREAAILDSIGGVVASIAHEIQNPLSGIKGVTQLLQRQLQHSAHATQSTEMILKELGRIDRLLKELLLHAQPLPLVYSSFNLHEILNTVVAFEENSTRPAMQIVRYFDPSLPEIVADRDKLHQVFLNLLKNAVEASPTGSPLFIRSSYCPQWEIVEKQLNIHQEYFRVDFEDQGSGVLPENRAHIFKPLFTTKKQGHGLGLSICFRIIAEHGGLLQHQAASPRGSIFQVYIPRTAAPSSNRS